MIDWKEFIIKQKVLYTYSYGWISSGGILFLVCDALKKYWPFSEMPIWGIFIIGLAGIWLIGYTLFRFGMFAKEQGFSTAHNPVLKQLINDSKK